VVSWVVTPWRWRQQGPPKLWYPTTPVHYDTTQKTTILNISRCVQFKHPTVRGAQIITVHNFCRVQNHSAWTLIPIVCTWNIFPRNCVLWSIFFNSCVLFPAFQSLSVTVSNVIPSASIRFHNLIHPFHITSYAVWRLWKGLHLQPVGETRLIRSTQNVTYLHFTISVMAHICTVCW